MIFVLQFVILAFAISFVMAGTYFDKTRTILIVGLKYFGLLCSAAFVLGLFLYISS